MADQPRGSSARIRDETVNPEPTSLPLGWPLVFAEGDLNRAITGCCRWNPDASGLNFVGLILTNGHLNADNWDGKTGDLP